MNDDKKKIVPVIINGELNDGKTYRRKKVHQEKLPSKKFGFSDVLLTLLGIFLIGYGIYGLFNKDNKKEEVVNNTSNVENKNVQNNIVSIDVSKYVKFTTEEISNIFTTQDLNLMQNGIKASDLSNNFKLSVAAKQTKKYKNSTGEYILQTDMEESIKKIFGNVSIINSSFTYGNNTYVYNQETKRYYLLDSTKKINLDYVKHDYIEKEEIDNKLIIRDFVAYTDNAKSRSWTLNNISLAQIIDSNNIKDNYTSLKYIEYQFIKDNENYYLDIITIK